MKTYVFANGTVVKAKHLSKIAIKIRERKYGSLWFVFDE